MISSDHFLSAPAVGRRGFLKSSALFAAAASLGRSTAAAQSAPAVAPRALPKIDHFLPVTDATAIDGFFSAETPPALRVKSGAVVKMDTVNLAGMPRTGLEDFVSKNKIPTSNAAVAEMLSIRRNVQPSGVRGHMMNGPIYIEEAEPGDTLEVRVLDIVPRTPFGVNSGRPGGGGLPDLVEQGWISVIWFDEAKRHALFSEGIKVPLAPFFGVMGTCPTPGSGKLSSIPPYLTTGGNLDNRHLGIGSTVFLPVQTKGALFQAGDGHTVQGNGEVSGTAIETSLTGTFQFFVHKGRAPLKAPRAENATHYIAHGLDPELNMAMRGALREAIAWLGEMRGLSFNQGLSLCSTAVDLEITQVVNGTKGVHAMIPKNLFSDVPAYWTA